MAVDFYNIFGELEVMGLFDIILPFLLVFSIIFAIINQTKILGGKKNIDVIVGFVIALLAVRNEYFVELMKTFLPNVAMFMIIILMFLLVLGIFAGQKKEWKNTAFAVGFVISIIFILFALFFDYTDRYVSFPDWLRDMFYGLDDRTKGVILFVAILVIVIWIATREKDDDKEGFWKNFWKGAQGGGE